jgi:hypothetical protein
MMNLFSEAARLNNQGITALMEGGEDSIALDSLTKSIKMMKRELSKSGTYLKNKALKSAHYDSSDSCELSTIEWPESPGTQEPYIFSKAFTIPEIVDVNELDVVHFYSAFVVFNLALAHHRKGKRGADAAYIVKAKALYSIVLKLFDNNSLSRTVILVKLAAINNMSQICFDLGLYDELACEGLGHISSFMRSSSGTSNQSVFDEPEVQSLLINVLLLKAPYVAPAA